MSTTTTTQTVAQFRASQVVFPQWMQDAVAGMSDTDTVAVTSRNTFAGRFVMSVAPATQA